MKGIIYKATIKKDGKKHSYIGKTCRTMVQRKKEHIRAALQLTKFHEAIKKHNHWKWTILEKNVSEKKIKQREDYWIDKLDTIENGFNMVGGMTKKDKAQQKRQEFFDIIFK